MAVVSNPFTLLKRTPIKKRRSKPRRGPLRDKGYRDWLRGRFICMADRNGWRDCSGVMDPAHTENNGMGSKGPDSSCVPLCRTHHREYDAGRKAFEKKYKVNMKLIAAQKWAEYQRERAV